MNGYSVEELYYLYRQNSFIARKLLIEYCYWQVEMMLPTYYFYSGDYRNERDDCIQDVVIRCIKNLDSYRPDKGMMVKSYLSLIIQRTISSIIVRERKKLVKEKMFCFSLNGYYSDDCKMTYLDVVKDNKVEYQPDVQVLKSEQKQKLKEYIMDNCSLFEQAVIKAHELGYRDSEIAKLMTTDIKKVYNANYRIQKKLSKLKLFD